VLFSLGVAQARRLANGTDADARRAARTIGPTRAIAGALLLIHPDALLRLLRTVPASTSPRWLAHMIGVRETILGLCTWTAGRTGRDVSLWLLAPTLVDAGEALVVLHAMRRHEVRLAPGSRSSRRTRAVQQLPSASSRSGEEGRTRRTPPHADIRDHRDPRPDGGR